MKSLLLFLLSVLFIGAAFSSAAAPDVTAQTASPSVTNAPADASLDVLKSEAVKIIDVQIAALNQIITQIESDSRLSAQQKTRLTANIQQLVAVLTNAKAEIEAAQTPEDVFSAVNSLVIRTTAGAADLASAQVNSLNGLQGFIDKLQAQGADVAVLQNLLDQMKGNVNAINTASQKNKAAMKEVVDQAAPLPDENVATGGAKGKKVLPPGEYKNWGQYNSQMRHMINELRKNMQAQGQDFTQLREEFKQMIEEARIAFKENPAALPSLLPSIMQRLSPSLPPADGPTATPQLSAPTPTSQP